MANNGNHSTQGVALSVSNQTLSLPALDGSRVKGVVVDDFETLREINPEDSEPTERLLFNQYEGDPTEGPDPGIEELSTEQALFSANSLKVTVSGGKPYIQFRPFKNGYGWHYLREQIKSGTWSLDTYNCMRIVTKLPPEVVRVGGGQVNFHIGTYFRGTAGPKSDAEGAGGTHWYHYFDVQDVDDPEALHTLLIYWHPSHHRGQGGGTEWPVEEYPTSEPGFNYFDLLTRFYFECKGITAFTTYPASQYVQGIDIYREERPQNILQVYNPHHVYSKTDNMLRVGWCRPKTEDGISHEVRFAFSDIAISGWDAATVAPGGSVAPLSTGGYNVMFYETTAINMGSNSLIYVAIKPTNSSEIHQVVVPLNNAAHPQLGGNV